MQVVARRLVDWQAIASFALAGDGSAYAGEETGYRVCGWSQSGELVWSRELPPRKHAMITQQHAFVQLVGDDLFAFASLTSALHVLDRDTGKTIREVAFPESYACSVTPDASTLVLISGTTQLLAYPSGAIRASFDQPSTGTSWAMRGSMLVTCGFQSGPVLYVYDVAKPRLVHTIEVPLQVHAVCFTADGRLVAGDVAGVVRSYNPSSGSQLAGPEPGPRARKLQYSKPRTIDAIAAGAQHIAAAHRNGTVTLFDSRTLAPSTSITGHDTAIPGSTSKHFWQVTFATDGSLWMSAHRKREPVGLICYPRPR